MVKDAWSQEGRDPGVARELKYYSRSYGGPEEEAEEEANEQKQRQVLHDDGWPLKLKFEKKNLVSGLLMGKCRRSPMTGEITMEKPPAFPNFQVVDLAGREILPRSRHILEEDKYLFKPIPLMYRTWLYQRHFVKPEGFGRGRDMDYTVRQALGAFCLDLPMWDGRWSPLMMYAIIMFMSALTCSSLIISTACGAGLMSCAISVSCNTPKAYRYDRWLSLPFRLAFLFYIFVVFPTESLLEILGTVVVLLLVLFELWAGDMSFFSTYRFHCSYTLLKCIGGRVYVCQREGAEGLQTVFGRTADRVDPDMVKMAKWTVLNHLIAEIEGMMVELRPMTPEDWSAAAQDYHTNFAPVTYIGLPIFEDDASEQEEDLEDLQDHIPDKMARGAVRGTQFLETLQHFRQAREIYGGNQQLDWMIEDVDFGGD